MADDILQARLALGIRDRGVAQQYADMLEKLGFRIVDTAARGVSFEGRVRLFEEVFASPVVLQPTPHFAGDLVLPSTLRAHTESVYFPTKPTFF